jgi:hypothetical protein
MDLRQVVPVLSQLCLQLSGVQHAVAAPSLEYLGLLLEGKVLPSEVGPNNLLEHGKNLIVRDGAGIGEIEDSRLRVLRHEDGGREQIVEYGVGVRHVNNSVILADLGDKVARMEIVANRHAEAEYQAVLVVLHDLARDCLVSVRGKFTIRLAALTPR